MESAGHLTLKCGALEFLRRLGCRVMATEVRCPIARYLVDVAGWLDHPQRTVMIECKQCRSDLLRDLGDRERLLEERAALERISRHLEERRIKVHEPHLRRSGSALFPELEQWDFQASRLDGYRRVLRRLRRLEQALHGQTKFFMIARYHLADRLYLAAPRGMVSPRELPPRWGLLECPRRALRAGCAAPPLRVVVEAPDLGCRFERRMRLLRNIAAAACRALAGVDYGPRAGGGAPIALQS